MYRPYELFIGLRYTRSKRRNHFISFISSISILGIIVGVMALIIVLSVMNGFEREVRERILSMVAHITVTDYGNSLQNWQEVVDVAKSHPRVVGVAPYIRAEGMLIYGTRVKPALFRGIEPSLEKNISQIADKMVKGKLADLKPGEFGIVLGRDLAAHLGVDVGDKVTMVTPSVSVTPAGILPRLKRFTVTGIFKVGFYEYDSGLGLINLKDAQRVFRLPGKVSGVQVQVDDLFDVGPIKHEFQTDLLRGHVVRDWRYYHSNWFKAVQMEKRMMSLLLFLILFVAAINIISTMVMVVTDKESDIAILRTFGASTKSIMRIFMIQGSVNGILGTILGGALGVILSLNLEDLVSWFEKQTGTKLIDPSVYLISDLPSDLHWHQVGWICLASLIVSVVATIFPARRASRIQPAEALRYE
jgi:lipoprotein-releasing system permease protein